MSFISSSLSPPSEQWDYDVFLSFRGEDTRKTFVAHLYRELSRAGINTFKDDETLRRGASISPQLISAIRRSRFAIIIFSKNYASSKWCLDELVKIMECRNELGQKVLPVFYDITPSEVRSQKTSFAEAFSRYEEDLKDDTKKVHSWRKALSKAANLSGHDLHSSTYNGNESWCIQQIVKDIANELCQKSMISGTLVVAESQIQAVSSLLMMECEDVRFIGVSGMGGIGKTTIARAIFYRFSHQFEGVCFVANIKENQDKQGLLFLQKTLLTNILTVESVNLADEYGGIDIIRKRLGFKKVLVVLDDVDHQDQLDGLAGAHDWFGKGSRIIITARDEHLLLNCDDTFKVSVLSIAEATRLFSWHAFRKTYPDNGFEQFSYRVVHYAGGLPLALKVLGSFLRGRSLKQWRGALDELQDIPSDEIISKLKISYDGLGDTVKQVFLDLACLFITSNADILKQLFSGTIIDVLVEKSLLFVLSSDTIGMHDLIREMGRRIAVQEYPRRRIWLHEDIADILTENKGGEAIEGIVIQLKSNSEEDTIHLSNEVFRHMKRLRIFISWFQNNFMHFCSHDPINFLPNSLCWLNWSFYPSPSLPETFNPPKLVGLIMSCSYVVNLWKGSKRLNRLTILDMSDSQKLIQISDLSGSPNLEKLILCRCIRLVEVHPSIGALKKLTVLDAEGCEKLERLPTKFQSGSLKILKFPGCRSLRKFPEIQQIVNRLTEFKQPYYGVLELTSSYEHNSTVLSFLDLSGCCNIETLPSSICRLNNLKFLYLNRCTKLKNLPEDICDLVNLEGLDASETSIWCTPNSITRLGKLKFLSFRKVPMFFHVNELCSWGCFAELDLSFQLPNVLSALCTLTSLNLSSCNLFDGSFPEDLGCLSSLVELNLSRNSFTYLPKSIAQLYRLRHLDISYCEKLKEMPELPPRIMKLFMDDRFAVKSIPTLSTMYKELYLVSFANQKLQEMWCNSRRGSSGVQMRNNDTLADILLPFLSMVQLKLVFDDPRRGGSFGIVFPRSDPSAKVPRWFKYHTTCTKGISLNLNKNWYNDKFLGFAIYCQLPFLNDGLPKNHYGKLAFTSCWGVTITIKLVPEHAAMDHSTVVKIVKLLVSNVVACDSHDCFIFLQFDLGKVHLKGKGKDTTLVNDLNDYCRFKASMDCHIPSNWGVRLVYADDIEVMRLKWAARQFNRFEHTPEEEDVELCGSRLERLSVPGEITYFYWILFFFDLPVLPTCPRCLSFAEDLTHVFLNCKYSQLVWEGSRLGLNFEVGTTRVEFQEWLVSWTLSAPKNEDLSFSLAVLWAIWKHRNELVHKRAVFVPSEVISTAVKEYSKFPYSEARAIRELYEVPRRTIVDLNAFNVDSDVQLDDNLLVIEVKGAWKEGQEWAGIAWIAYKKCWLKVAAARRSVKVTSKLHAEVHAFVHAMRWATLFDSKILVLSDNATLIKELHSSDRCSDQDIVYMLNECLKSMEGEETSWEVVKVPSYGVSAAKKAAKMAMKTYMDVLNMDPYSGGESNPTRPT